MENAFAAHEMFAEPSDMPDASEAFRQQAPSVRASLVAVDAYLGGKDED